ncbi:hypothetical protein, partial [Pseudohalocynthiibacter sp. F2068]|uniref:hypothetical protein n=1 Tax=Pseudohalocynthiibacter sp. F2068 TaxID=2926418 RepID=UPI001FF644F7
NSTSDLERPCNTKRQQRNLKHVLRRSVETTPHSGHLRQSACTTAMRTEHHFAALVPMSAVGLAAREVCALT